MLNKKENTMLNYPGSESLPWNKIPLGIDSQGEQVQWNTTTNPHMLVCGQVGTGKSILQRNVFLHLLQHSDRWSFIGIDPKRVELKPYAKYTDTVLGIGTNLEESAKLIQSVHDLMNERYKMMENLGVNNFTDLPDPSDKAILVMVDEVSPLLSQHSNDDKDTVLHKKEIAVHLQDIARLGRAAGVHLLLATQRPDATVIKGELKNNLGARIVCGKASPEVSSLMFGSDLGTEVSSSSKRGLAAYRFNDSEGEFDMYYSPQDWFDNKG